MSRLQLGALAITVFVLLYGLQLRLTASPVHVFGSPNLPVDTYRNIEGTFLLWSNGRITNVSGGGNDLGRPYRDPLPGAEIAPPVYEPEGLKGSPNVAVQAIARPDATYVLFSDGTLRRPGADNAAAAAAEGATCTLGGWGWNSGATTDYQATVSASGLTVNLDSPPPAGATAWAIGYQGPPEYFTPFMYLPGTIGGSTVSFGSNPNVNDLGHGTTLPNGFFIISGE